MNYTHPIIARIEKEHNYARPWYKKLNSSQKFPSRITKFLFLKNFPRHFLSKYPNAFSTINLDGTIDVGSVEDLQPIKTLTNTTTTTGSNTNSNNNNGNSTMDVDLVDEDLNEQENDNRVEEPALDTSMWTQQMDRLYYKILQILQQYYLTKLVYENLPNGPIRMVNLMENTSLQLRHSFANIAGWDNELLIWLHRLLITKVPTHEHLMPVYHEVMQYLNKRLPSLIEKFYSIDRISSSIATTPATSAATTPVHPASGGGGVAGNLSGAGQQGGGGGQRTRHSSVSQQHVQPNTLSLEDDPAARFMLDSAKSTTRRLTSNPLILLVPGCPSIPTQPTSARMEYWKILLSSMGQLINVNIPYRPEQSAVEILQVIKTSVRDKIRDTRKKKFNELRPIILVGFNQGALIAIHCAIENPGQISSVICLGFPLTSINGFRGDLDDPMLDMNIPILFVVGQTASTATLDALERLRESMTRSDTGLIVVGGANDKLIVSYKKKLYDGITQYHVDKSVADEIFEFVNSINMQQPDVYS